MKKNQAISINDNENISGPINKELLTQLTVRSSDFALKYLETKYITKPQYNRLISWFYKFKLSPENSSELSTKLNELINQYENLKNSSGFKDESQIEEIKKGLPDIIPRDLDRSFKLFLEYLDSLNLNENLFTSSEFRIHRIFYFMQQNCPNFEYLQGFDRYAYLCICVSISFCDRLKLDSNIAEAFAYFALYYFISYVSIANEVLDPDENLLISSDLDASLNKWSSATASAYKYQNLKPDMYSMNFLLLLFADQHEPLQTLAIWDLIILHTDFQNRRNDRKKREFIYALTVAHLNQIQIGQNKTETIQRILKTKEFNFQRLVDDANRFVSRRPVEQITTERRGGIPPFVVMIGVGAIAVVAGIVLFNLLKD